MNFLRRLALQEKKLDDGSRLDVVEIARVPDIYYTDLMIIHNGMASLKFKETNFMEQSPCSEADSFVSWSRNSSHFMEPKSSLRVHKSLPLDPALYQMILVHASPSCFF